MVKRQTKIWHTDQQNWKNDLSEAAAALQKGELVAFPTETVYGLGADARNTEAVKAIFEAKGRPSDNPLIVHIAHRDQLKLFVDSQTHLAEALMDTFWPGPLTIILPVKTAALSPLVTAGLPTVAVRMPSHPVALELIASSQCPIAAPSANRSGRPSPTKAKHVAEDLNGTIAGIVDGGATGVGLESTVVEIVNEDTIRILRPGGVTSKALQAAFPDSKVIMEQEHNTEAPRSPGMKYTHYAPQGKLSIVSGDTQQVIRFINEQIHEQAIKYRIGVLTFDEHIEKYDQQATLISLGSITRLEQAAARLYDALRQFDELKIEYIWSEAVPAHDIGEALMNRLLKAAGHNVISV